MLFRKDLAETLLKDGREVHILIPFQERLRPLADLGAKIHHIDCSNNVVSPWRDIKLFYQLVMVLTKIKPDVSFCYFIKPVLYGALASRLAGVQHICSLLTGIGYVFTSKTSKAKTIRLLISPLYGLAMKCSDRILFQNIDNKNLISNLFGGIKPKCFVVDGSGVNMDVYRRTEPLQCGRASFILAGRLLRAKGICEYIKAANILKKRYPHSFDAVLVGAKSDSPDALTYPELAQLNTQGAVDVLEEKSQKELISVYQKCNVFVLPSYYGEGIPRSLLEAMSMKMALITTDWPGCRETVSKGENGLLVKVRSVGELTEAMEKLILNPKIISKWGERSFKIVRKRFETTLINKEYLKHINAG